MIKKIFLILTILCLFSAVYAEEPSEWAEEYVKLLMLDKDYSDGRLESDFHSQITREDFAYIGVKVYEAITGETCEKGNAYFSDSKDDYILKAKNHGIVGGYGNGIYGPNDSITRQDLTVLFKNILDQSGVSFDSESNYVFKDENQFSNYAKEAIYIAYSNGVINGIGNDLFDPRGYATREQAIIMLIKMQDVFKDKGIHLSNNRDYDWYVDQVDTGIHADNNCGPSSAVMAAKYQNESFQLSASDARELYKDDGGWWYTNDIDSFYDAYDISYKVDGYDGYYELKNVIDQGDISLICINTAYITESDIKGQQTNRFYSYADGHFLIVKGYKKINDQFYFEVYDPNNWGEIQADGTAKGQDRYYLASEISEAIENWWNYYYIIDGE